MTGSADGGEVEIAGSHLLAAVAPAVVDGWLDRATEIPTGAQIKINMLLDRLPRLASGLDPRTAFAGTMHLDEGFWDLEAAYATTAGGQLPAVVPAEVYCHSLADPSILTGIRVPRSPCSGCTPRWSCSATTRMPARAQAAQAALIALQRHLAEPLLDCLARDAAGQPCLDISSPVDLERASACPAATSSTTT